jgi:phosphatidylserine synthase
MKRLEKKPLLKFSVHSGRIIIYFKYYFTIMGILCGFLAIFFDLDNDS